MTWCRCSKGGAPQGTDGRGVATKDAQCGRSCGALGQPGAGDLPAKRRATPGTISKAVPGGFNTSPAVPGRSVNANGNWRPGKLCGPPGIAGDLPYGNGPVV
eukprot:366395-Chlamydomonas_euryale.AAC.14